MRELKAHRAEVEAPGDDQKWWRSGQDYSIRPGGAIFGDGLRPASWWTEVRPFARGRG